MLKFLLGLLITALLAYFIPSLISLLLFALLVIWLLKLIINPV